VLFSGEQLLFSEVAGSAAEAMQPSASAAVESSSLPLAQCLPEEEDYASLVLQLCTAVCFSKLFTG